MRWEVNLNRVLEALTAIERTVQDLDPGKDNPNLDQWSRHQRAKETCASSPTGQAIGRATRESSRPGAPASRLMIALAP